MKQKNTKTRRAKKNQTKRNRSKTRGGESKDSVRVQFIPSWFGEKEAYSLVRVLLGPTDSVFSRAIWNIDRLENELKTIINKDKITKSDGEEFKPPPEKVFEISTKEREKEKNEENTERKETEM